MEQLPDLNALLVYTKVVEYRSFTEAAHVLKMQKSTVSRLVANLESSLKCQLLYRTTRQVEPTPQGKELIANCSQNFSALLAGLEKSLKNTAPMQGRIRIAAVQDIGVVLLSPVITEFAQLHPMLEVEMLFDDKVIDLVSNAVDISVRAGKVSQQSYRGRKVGTVRFILVSSPKYLERVGAEITWETLNSLDFLSYQPMLQKGYFVFERNKQKVKLVPRLRYQSASTLTLLRMTCESAGISALPDFLCEDALKQNKLVQIQKGWTTPPTPISVITPAKRDPNSTISIFSDFLSKRLVDRFL